MQKTLLKIKKEVPTTIFEVPKIKVRVDTLFDEMEDDIKSRFNEIKAFITEDNSKKQMYGNISYDEIVTFFKMYFYKSILNEVVEMTFTQDGKYNVVKNILEVLTEERLKDAIWGEPMVYAFEKFIRNQPADTGLTRSLHGSTIILLEMEFLDRSYS